MEQRARARSVEGFGERPPREIAGPAGDPAEELAGFQRAHVLHHPLQAVRVAERFREVVLRGERLERRDELVSVPGKRRLPRGDVRRVAPSVGKQPRRRLARAPLRRVELGDDGIELVGTADDERVVRHADLDPPHERGGKLRRLTAGRQYEQARLQDRSGRGQRAPVDRRNADRIDDALP